MPDYVLLTCTTVEFCFNALFLHSEATNAADMLFVPQGYCLIDPISCFIKKISTRLKHSSSTLLVHSPLITHFPSLFHISSTYSSLSTFFQPLTLSTSTMAPYPSHAYFHIWRTDEKIFRLYFVSRGVSYHVFRYLIHHKCRTPLKAEYEIDRCVARTQRTYPEDCYSELIGPHNWNINTANDFLITHAKQDVEPEHFGALTTFSHKDGSEQIVREAIPCLIAILRIL